MQNTTSNRRPYPSDVSDDIWPAIERVLDRADASGQGRGRPVEIPRREIVNAIVYHWNAGIVWRALPHDFPRWETVYCCYNRWREDGRLAEIRRLVFDGETTHERLAREREEQRAQQAAEALP